MYIKKVKKYKHLKIEIMRNSIQLPRNISNETKNVFTIITNEGHYVEARIHNNYAGHALWVLEKYKMHFECRFPNEKFIGVR